MSEKLRSPRPLARRENPAILRKQRLVDRIVLAWQLCGLAAVLAYSAYLHPWPSRAALRPAAVGALLAGGITFLGFITGLLFGIPKTRVRAESVTTESDSAASHFVPNTNLEQISDWLTKILVGVALTQAEKIGSSLWRFAGQFSPVFGEEAEARAFVIALMAYFVFTGFMSGYFWTRMFLAGAFAMAEGELHLSPPSAPNAMAGKDQELGTPGVKPANPAPAPAP